MKKTTLRQSLFKFGETIPGLVIHGKPAPYPVLNEREVRAGAGVMLVMAMFSFFHAFYLQDFLYLKVTVSFFFLEFFLKTVVGTRFSIVRQLVRPLVRNQAPEYVGAVQKRFAWGLGLAMSTAMLVMLFGFGTRGLPNLIMCGICMTLMFLETSFGICVGCKIYGFLLRRGWIAAPEHRPACPGNVCSIE
jgi:hypothetical protein